MALEPLEITGGLAIGVGVGGAISAVVEPKLQGFRNDVWGKYPNKPLSAHEAAELAAQRSTSPYATYVEALKNGYDADRFADLVFLAAEAPGTPELLELWRRDKIDKEQVRAGLYKAGLLEEYIDPVLELFSERLDPAVIAVAVQRGLLPNPGLLPVGPPTEVGKVPPMPEVAIDPVHEAQAHGIDKDRLEVLTRIVGLPASPDLAARMVFREIIERVDFDRAIAEGNTRNEWAPFLFDAYREILTAHDYAELQLRGYLSEAQRRANTAKHGMSDTDSDLLYDLLGRSINVHQILIGQRRGGTYEGPTGKIPPEYLAALERGNLRPEYYNLAYAGRETYPSYFVTRALAQGGVIDAKRTEELFLGLGWPVDVAEAAAHFYAKATTKAADPHIAKADTHLWGTTHNSYKAREIGTTEARQAFNAIGIPADAQSEILILWNVERDLIRRQLTPADIRKAMKDAVPNPATGHPWTLADAKAALLERGYDDADATTYLTTP